MKVVAALCLFLCFLSCQKQPPHEDYLGVVNLRVTGNEAAVPYFEKGLLLLHSFEYEDAREEFLKAQELDPAMAMAYWGEAMTYNHSLWSEQSYEEGRSALERLRANCDLESATALERDFVRAVEILYRPEADKNERDQAYSGFMQGLYEKYPDNHEVAAFYSLSLLGSVPAGRDYEIYGQGAIVAQGILANNPKHPGALHYLIHSYDDPTHAQLALGAADAYAKVAPDASHALHMPSHIYVALGMWDEVVASNAHSYQASLNRMARKKLDNDARGYHAFHWLEYGYLQQGRLEDARQLVLEMEEFTKENPSKRARTHLVFLKGTFLTETNLWESPLADIAVHVSDLNVSIRSQYNFIEGMKAYQKRDRKTLDEAIATINKSVDLESALANDAGASFCLSVTRDKANRIDMEQSRVMEMQLRGLHAWMDDDSNSAEEWLRKSVELEESLSYSYGPPFIQKPTHELYAEWLLAHRRPEEALELCDRGLQRATKRVLTLKRKQEAALATGNRSLAEEIGRVLREIQDSYPEKL